MKFLFFTLIMVGLWCPTTVMGLPKKAEQACSALGDLSGHIFAYLEVVNRWKPYVMVKQNHLVDRQCLGSCWLHAAASVLGTVTGRRIPRSFLYLLPSMGKLQVVEENSRITLAENGMEGGNMDMFISLINEVGIPKVDRKLRKGKLISQFTRRLQKAQHSNDPVSSQWFDFSEDFKMRTWDTEAMGKVVRSHVSNVNSKAGKTYEIDVGKNVKSIWGPLKDSKGAHYLLLIFEREIQTLRYGEENLEEGETFTLKQLQSDPKSRAKLKGKYQLNFNGRLNHEEYLNSKHISAHFDFLTEPAIKNGTQLFIKERDLLNSLAFAKISKEFFVKREPKLFKNLKIVTDFKYDFERADSEQTRTKILNEIERSLQSGREVYLGLTGQHAFYGDRIVSVAASGSSHALAIVGMVKSHSETSFILKDSNGTEEGLHGYFILEARDMFRIEGKVHAIKLESESKPKSGS